ncbi:MAG TPA: hypothetical protein PLN33_17145 [Hyphomonadaceae bacterium]|nr:hypothetical protein [Hyphomonadaceae bacterium]HPN05642.1 hypothetical protein [Hyphomonadaceae bacterium]
MLSYRWAVPRFTKIWRSQIFRPHRITFQTTALSDFHVSIGEDDIKFFPFLNQRSVTSGDSANTYLRIGDQTNGIAYFEDAEAWGACRPVEQNGHTQVRVEIEDGFGHKHRQTVTIPVVAIEEAKKYNPRFGESRDTVSTKNNAN